jgi:plasmid stabilization system protein ParE
LVRIGRNAGIGHSRETLNSKLVGVRAYHVVGFPNHLVFYRVLDNSTVRILRIRHGAMDMDAVPMDDDE